MQAQVDLDTAAFDTFADQLGESSDLTQGGSMEQAALSSIDLYWEAMRNRFDQYSSRGGDWAEHAPSTIRKRGAGAPLLVESGALRQSLERSGEDHVIEVQSDGVTEGTQNPVARYQQDGVPQRNLPARPFAVAPQSETLDEMKTELVAGVKGIVREASSLAKARVPVNEGLAAAA